MSAFFEMLDELALGHGEAIAEHLVKALFCNWCRMGVPVKNRKHEIYGISIECRDHMILKGFGADNQYPHGFYGRTPFHQRSKYQRAQTLGRGIKKRRVSQI